MKVRRLIPRLLGIALLLFSARLSSAQYTERIDDSYTDGVLSSRSRTTLQGDASNGSRVATFYDWVDNDWWPVNRNHSHFGDDGLIAATVHTYWTGSEWKITRRYSYEYDAEGRRVSQTAESWNGTAYDKLYRELSAYDAEGRPIEYAREYWIDGGWQFGVCPFCRHHLPSSRSTVAYAANTREYLWLTWNAGWDPVRREVREYNDSGQQLTWLRQDWADGAWQNRRWETFNETGTGVTESEHIWHDWTDGTWVPTRRQLTTRDADGQWLGSVTQSRVDSDWLNVSRIVNTYGLWGQDRQEVQRWQSGGWGTTSRVNWTYDGEGLLIEQKSGSWTGSVWQLTRVTTYGYGAVVSVEPSPEHARGLELFPNPVAAGEALHIQLPESAEVHLFDVTGRLVRTGIGDTQRLSTSGLTPGLYFVRVQLNHRVETRPVTIVR
ncbi:MAG: T9SS type A sorting domain-containing protein [Rhodothermales bacterium]|nr:T9SS type A sorting domain-containing protein [Rhodothermales bacterium]MBO6778656.1 T9SS type A sorting domain-containing protein [Rhodothermales bacterium]